MRRAPRLRSQRRGIATLELVLLFPILLLIVSALYLIAREDVAKVQAATDARAQTWRKRPDAPGGRLLQPLHNPADSRVSTLPQRSVSGAPVFTGQTFQAQSGNTLVGNPWDSQDKGIPFRPRLQKNMVPHTDELAMIGTDVTKGIFVGFQILFDPGMDAGGNPALQAARIAGTGKSPVPGLNDAVKIAGDALEYPVGAAIHAVFSAVDDAWNVLNDITFGFAGHTKQGKKIKKTLDTITTYLDFFHNLYEASRGRPGNDPFSDN